MSGFTKILVSKINEHIQDSKWAAVSRRFTGDESCNRVVCKAEILVKKKWRNNQTMSTWTYPLKYFLNYCLVYFLFYFYFFLYVGNVYRDTFVFFYTDILCFSAIAIILNRHSTERKAVHKFHSSVIVPFLCIAKVFLKRFFFIY